MRLWHATSETVRAAILAKGFRDNEGFILAGTSVELAGAFLADRPLDENEGCKGSSLVAVEVPDDVDLDEYEVVNEPFVGYREWVVPAELVNTWPRHADDEE